MNVYGDQNHVVKPYYHRYNYRTNANFQYFSIITKQILDIQYSAFKQYFSLEFLLRIIFFYCY